MSKYNDTELSNDELESIQQVIDLLSDFDYSFISLDHLQIGNRDGDVIGKVSVNDKNEWVFKARRHDKPSQLGE